MIGGCKVQVAGCRMQVAGHGLLAIIESGPHFLNDFSVDITHTELLPAKP